MPPVVAAVGAFVNAALVTVLGTGVAFTVGVYAVNALGYIAVQAILNSAVKALSKRPKSGESRGLEVTVTDSAADGRIIYGNVRVSGVNVIPPLTSGSSGRYLHQVLALAIHECDSFGDVYFWQDEIATGTIFGVSGSSGDGEVVSGKYANRAWIRRYRGTSTQTTDYILNAAYPSTFTSDFRGRGICYVALQYDWGDGKLYSGYPPATFEVNGARVYDPRLDSTNGGSGTHRYATPSTWTYSNNPALCWANYKMASYGFGEDASNIDWPSVAAAADVCDALVNIPGPATEKRYTLNGVLLSTNDPRDNEKKILDAMLGHMTFVNGKWTVHAGSWVSASYTIEKTDWLGISEIQTVAERDGGRWNRTRCFFVDPNRNWQRVECSPRYNDTYKSDDAGERIDLEIEQPLVTGEYQAQRIAEVVLRQSRNGQRLVGTLPPRFHRMSTFETVALNFDELGWVSKTFRVVSMDLNPDGSVNVALIEEQSGDWTDMASGDYNSESTVSLPSTNPTSPTEPQNFTLVPDFGVLKLDWDPPVVVPTGTRYRVVRSPGSASAVQSGEVMWDGLTSDALFRADPRSPYWYHVQAYAGSYFGPYYPNTSGLLGIPWPNESDLVGSRIIPDGELTFATNSYWSLSGGSVVAQAVGLGGRGRIQLAKALKSYAIPLNPKKNLLFTGSAWFPAVSGQQILGTVAGQALTNTVVSRYTMYSYLAFSDSVVYSDGGQANTVVFDGQVRTFATTWAVPVNSFYNAIYFELQTNSAGHNGNDLYLYMLQANQ